jgi:hypothetical protein
MSAHPHALYLQEATRRFVSHGRFAPTTTATGGEKTHTHGAAKWLFAVEDVGVDGAFDRDTATGALPIAHRVARPANIPAIVIYRQEVRPMYAISAVGAPLQSTIARLR